MKYNPALDGVRAVATPTFLIVAPLTLAIAALSFEFVEKPLREMRKRQPATVREAR
ncbi:hypothetical protein HB777_20110 [Mesorhizobium loti]|nr:hypothetical protein HB777_20110 [Mesorhizobium loti]